MKGSPENLNPQPWLIFQMGPYELEPELVQRGYKGILQGSIVEAIKEDTRSLDPKPETLNSKPEPQTLNSKP